MTPEQRLDRIERILGLFVNAGRRVRKQAREQDERIGIIIRTQQETEEIMKGLALSQARAANEMTELRREQRLTFQVLRAFINSQRKGQNGNSTN